MFEHLKVLTLEAIFQGPVVPRRRGDVGGGK